MAHAAQLSPVHPTRQKPPNPPETNQRTRIGRSVGVVGLQRWGGKRECCPCNAAWLKNRLALFTHHHPRVPLPLISHTGSPPPPPPPPHQSNMGEERLVTWVGWADRRLKAVVCCCCCWVADAALVIIWGRRHRNAQRAAEAHHLRKRVGGGGDDGKTGEPPGGANVSRWGRRFAGMCPRFELARATRV